MLIRPQPMETPLTRSSDARDPIADRGRHAPGDAPRPMVTDSWRRSLAAGVDPGLASAPLVFDADMIAAAYGGPTRSTGT